MFADFELITLIIRRLKFERQNSDEFSYYFKSRELLNLANVSEAHIACADKIIARQDALLEHP